MGIFSFLKKPIDCGIKINGIRVFGQNKTYLGFIVMTVLTGIWGLFFYRIYAETFKLNWNNSVEIWISFSLIGLFYSLGELPNSFIKRRLGILPGKQSDNRYLKFIFRIIDLSDSLLSIGIIYYWLFGIELSLLLLTLLIGIIIHFVFDVLMLKLKLKKSI